MKAKLSMAFSDLRGSDGTVTARMSRSGLTLVEKITPRNPETDDQLSVRGNLKALGAAFRTLDQAGRDAWESFGGSTRKTNVVNGTTYSSTGYAAFVALNGVKLRTSATAQPILLPPTAAFVSPNIGLSLDVSSGQIDVIGTASTPSGCLLEVRTARMTNVTNKTPKSGYVSAGFFSLTSANGNTASITMPNGAFALQYRWVSLVDGQTSRYRSLGKVTVGLSLVQGGMDEATGEGFAPAAKPARMKKAA